MSILIITEIICKYKVSTVTRNLVQGVPRITKDEDLKSQDRCLPLCKVNN